MRKKGEKVAWEKRATKKEEKSKEREARLNAVKT